MVPVVGPIILCERKHKKEISKLSVIVSCAYKRYLEWSQSRLDFPNHLMLATWQNDPISLPKSNLLYAEHECHPNGALAISNDGQVLIVACGGESEFSHSKVNFSLYITASDQVSTR